MSLKAKIEAVIYASEEPVTLAQLVSLLGEEGQAEVEALASQQTSLDLRQEADEDAGGPEALNDEIVGHVPADEDAEPAPVSAEATEETAADSEPAGTELAGEPEPANPPEASAEVVAAAPAPSAAEEKKLASDRERKLREHFKSLLSELIADYTNGDRGLEIREVAGGYRLATRPEYHDAVRGFVKSLKPPLKLSLQALETLAVVAYKQPVTAPEISEIRGVDSGGVLGGLMTRKLVTTAGRKQVIGRPILYKTTKDFLVRFGLKDIAELPSIEEFEKMAGELADLDPVQEEIPMDDAKVKLDDISVDEVNAAPEGEDALHETPEDMISDKAVKPDGAKHEPESAPELEAAHDVEPNADVHEAQADGIPDLPEAEQGDPYTGNDERGA